jgi:hypothetical protein
MTPRLDRRELPARFLERFRPVKADGRQKGLAAYLFDANGLAFYRQMTTAAALPDGAVWSVVRPPEGALQLAHGQDAAALGYVVAQAVPGDGDAITYPLPLRLSYRAKVAVQALRQLRGDLTRSDGQDHAADILAVIDRRIAAYHRVGA